MNRVRTDDPSDDLASPADQVFHYRIDRRLRGERPGAHQGLALGAGLRFAGHARLFDRPDPRRLDLRASLRNPWRDWLVRVNRQQSSAAIHAVVDVSRSMRVAGIDKLEIAARFIEHLNASTHRSGDSLGLIAFDQTDCQALYRRARPGGGTGADYAALLRAVNAQGDGWAGFADAVQRITHRDGLIFLVSDFHGPLDRLNEGLDLLETSRIVPVVIWHSVETEPPARNGLLSLRDAERGSLRTVFMRQALRDRWRARITARREALIAFFATRGVLPFFVLDRFDGEAMTRYFMAGQA